MNLGTITTKQVDNMLHAIGYKEDKILGGVYNAYRTHYCTNIKNDEGWENLVKLGFAEACSIDPRIIQIDSRLYHVTRKGMDYLEDIIGAKIVERD